ncbi:hypothetical protein, partial [Paenibacillus sp.]|uniref:hypothetical protein n=1 Tax=Paenibacillus sp. TaxID=58172 RepID=UPI002D6146D3
MAHYGIELRSGNRNWGHVWEEIGEGGVSWDAGKELPGGLRLRLTPERDGAMRLEAEAAGAFA